MREHTGEVEFKFLETEMASLDLSTTSLNSCGVSLIPSKWKHSISHIVGALNSLELPLKSISSSLYASLVEGNVPCST